MGGSTRAIQVGIVVLVLLGPFAAADPAAPQNAAVRLSGPAEVRLEGDGPGTFVLQVSSQMDCQRGFDRPRDLVVYPAAEKDDPELPYRFDPAAVTITWKAGDRPDTFVIDERIHINVTSSADPATRVESEAVVLVREVQDAQPRLHCGVDGYTLEVEHHEMAVVVVPEEQGPSGALEGERPPVQVVPMVLAVSILMALALFASLRERQRRRGA